MKQLLTWTDAECLLPHEVPSQHLHIPNRMLWGKSSGSNTRARAACVASSLPSYPASPAAPARPGGPPVPQIPSSPSTPQPWNHGQRRAQVHQSCHIRRGRGGGKTPTVQTGLKERCALCRIPTSAPRSRLSAAPLQSPNTRFSLKRVFQKARLFLRCWKLEKPLLWAGSSNS